MAKRINPPAPNTTTTVESTASTSKMPIYISLAVLALAILVGYIGALQNTFVNWDDYDYIIDNPYLKQPGQHLGSLMRDVFLLNYHPLTMLSYALNVGIWGQKATSFIAINILLHLLNTAFVFFLAKKWATGSIFVGLLTALLFAIHPLHVESVVWISERKDVLYAFFFLAALWQYERYTDTQYASKGRLFATGVLFLLSCLSKPMAVTLPLVLLLLDFWHGRNLKQSSVWIEKIPFFALSLLFGFITLDIQSGGDFFGILHHTLERKNAIDEGTYSLWETFTFGCYGYVMYIIKFFIPIQLSPYYPYPEAGNTSGIYTVMPLVAVAIIAAAIGSLRKTRRVAFGIGFYTFTIFIVLQFVAVGTVIMADRYTYIPLVGLAFLLSYTLWKIQQQWATGLGAIFVLICLILTTQQVKVWHDTLSLWEHVLSIFPNQAHVLTMRGNFQGRNGNIEAAMKDLEAAVAAGSKRAETYEGLGNAYGSKGETAKAIEMFNQAITLNPNSGNFYYNRAVAKSQLNQNDSAIADFSEALTRLPHKTPMIKSARGIAYIKINKTAEALADLNDVIAGGTTDATVYYYRAALLQQQGNTTAARADAQKALSLNPNLQEAKQLLLQLGG